MRASDPVGAVGEGAGGSERGRVAEKGSRDCERSAPAGRAARDVASGRQYSFTGCSGPCQLLFAFHPLDHPLHVQVQAVELVRIREGDLDLENLVLQLVQKIKMQCKVLI